MANHLLFVPFLLAAEGGRSKDPNDAASQDPVPDGSGYHTNKGVTWRTFKAWAKPLGYTATAVLFYEMPPRIWASIFKQGYWDRVGGDHIETQAVADILADWAYNGGYSVKWLQKTLNEKFGGKLPVDGKLGASTMAALNAANPTRLYQLILTARTTYYQTLARNNAKHATQLPGWLNRLARLNAFEKKKHPLPPDLVASYSPALPSSTSPAAPGDSRPRAELAPTKPPGAGK